MRNVPVIEFIGFFLDFLGKLGIEEDSGFLDFLGANAAGPFDLLAASRKGWQIQIGCDC